MAVFLILNGDEVVPAGGNETHFAVGQKVRETIHELGGTMPEDLPRPERSIRQIETAQGKLPKKDI